MNKKETSLRLVGDSETIDSLQKEFDRFDRWFDAMKHDLVDHSAEAVMDAYRARSCIMNDFETLHQNYLSLSQTMVNLKVQVENQLKKKVS